MRAARLHGYTDETTALAPDLCAAGGDHHIIGYGGHIHEPAQALVERDEVNLHTTRYDLGEINGVAERLERGEIDGRAVITP